ncbi:MAG: recombinase family protein [Dehalococcoidia bacterium]|nr:recombinase family protein [Dehalococcoidia bacterium]
MLLHAPAPAHTTTAGSLVRAATYCRVSTDRQAQEGVSLDVQRDACREFAQAQGWPLAQEYVDDESSYAPRASYQQMIRDALEGGFGKVVVYDFSRFGRDIAQSTPDIARLEKLGVQVVAVSSPHAGRLERNIYFTLADYYSYELSRKVKPSHIKRVQDGLWVSRPPVGYNLEPVGPVGRNGKAPKRLVPDPEMAPQVERLFRLFAAGGYSLNALAREADAMGLRSHTGHPLARSAIASLLRNPAYIGQVVYNRRSLSKFEKRGKRPPTEWVTAPGQHKPLVEREVFETVGELLARHRRAYGCFTGGRPLLTGVLFCGACGSKMLGRVKGRPRKGEGQARYYYTAYQCYRYQLYRDCANGGYYGGKTLEDWARGQLRRLPITEADRRAAMTEVHRIINGQAGDTDAQRKALEQERDAHLAELKALSWRLVRDEIPASVYAEMRKEKEAAVQDIERRIAELSRAESLDDQASEALAFLANVNWDDFDAQAWKEALAVLVERVVVEGRGSYRIEWRPGVAELLGDPNPSA